MTGFLSTARNLVVAGFLVSTTLGQVSGGAFRGEVRDASNAVVPQTKILIRSNDNGMQTYRRVEWRGAVRHAHSDSRLVPAQRDQTGFQNRSVRSRPASRSTRPFALTSRSAWAPLPSPSRWKRRGAIALDGKRGDFAGHRQQTGCRNSLERPQLAAAHRPERGVNPGAPGESGSPNPVNVDGQRTKANLFLVDGISVTSSAEGRGNDFNIPLEAVQEFSVQAGSYSAEYGDVAGGVINLQSKSGTNNWHGSLFEFFRNDAMDAANFFSNPTGQPKNPLQYNQFGGSLGGPIRHNKTFFFADYQGTITHSADPMVTSVPLARNAPAISPARGARPDLQSVRRLVRAHAISEQHDSRQPHRSRRGENHVPAAAAEPVRRERPSAAVQ